MGNSWVEDIKFNNYSCYNQINERVEYATNCISLYVVLTRECNVKCKFCTFRGKTEEIDIECFKERFRELLKVTDISTVHFTGGEPSLRVETLKELCRFIKEETKGFTDTSINTNGSNLDKLSGIEELDNIALSRHHYNDEKNKELFGSEEVPSKEDIKRFKDTDKIHLSCNIVKGYIDNAEEIKKYLEFASEIGCNDVGFVSLMEVNDYCKEHYVDFKDIDIESIETLQKTRHFYKTDECNKEICRCANFLYIAKDMRLISIYHRYAVANKSISDYLVYENNHIKQGFSGKEII